MVSWRVISDDSSQDVIIDLDDKVMKFSHEEAEDLIDDIEKEILNYKPLIEKFNKISKEEMEEIIIIKTNKIKDKITDLRKRANEESHKDRRFYYLEQIKLLEEILNNN